MGAILPRIAATLMVLASFAVGQANHDALADAAAPASPFNKFAGRWTGEGRLWFRDKKMEAVKCRVTYFVSATGLQLTQNIRCASAGGGNVDLQAVSDLSGEDVKGTWNEKIYNLNGGIAGKLTDHGLRVVVTGSDLSANMDLIVKDSRQIVEIQFHNSVLVGLTLVLAKG